MNTIEAIHERRSQAIVEPDEIPKEQVAILLDAAVQAPNHYKVRPWRFTVIRGRARERLGEAMVAALRRKRTELDDNVIERERRKPLRAPLIIAVGVDAPEDARVIEVENICAAAAACQNILLAATEMGLASYWRTGESARDPEVKEYLGLSPDQHLIAFLYLGKPGAQGEFPARPGFDDRTTWLD